LSSEPHRIPNTSGLKGTLLHEYGHVLQQGEFWNEWRKAFGWVSKPEEEIDWKVATPRMHDTNQPERCVSDYARISPDEDICESFAAAVNNPAVLDPERLEFIRERWLKSIQETGSMPVSIEVRAGDDIQLPKAPYVVKYKTTVSRVFIPGKVVDKE